MSEEQEWRELTPEDLAFRENAKNKLNAWRASMFDQLMMQTLGNVGYRIRGYDRSTTQARWDTRKEKMALHLHIGKPDASAQSTGSKRL